MTRERMRESQTKKHTQEQFIRAENNTRQCVLTTLARDDVPHSRSLFPFCGWWDRRHGCHTHILSSHPHIREHFCKIASQRPLLLVPSNRNTQCFQPDGCSSCRRRQDNTEAAVIRDCPCHPIQKHRLLYHCHHDCNH